MNDVSYRGHGFAEVGGGGGGGGAGGSCWDIVMRMGGLLGHRYENGNTTQYQQLF